MLFRKLALVAAALTLALSAHAQFPQRTITVVSPFPAGSLTDNVARVLTQAMSESLGQPVIVENKPGADGQIAAQDVLHASADGYRIMIATSGNMSILPALKKQPPYDAVKDFTPIADIGRFQFFLFVHPSLPVKTFAEFVDYARKRPNDISYGSGNATGVMSMAMIRSIHGLDMVGVPYKGEPPALQDLMAGRVQAMVSSTAALPFARDGRVRPVISLSANRSALFPDVPTYKEATQRDLLTLMWAGFFGPKGMPAEITNRLAAAIKTAMDDRAVQQRISSIGFLPGFQGPAALGVLVRDQLDAHNRIAAATKLTID